MKKRIFYYLFFIFFIFFLLFYLFFFNQYKNTTENIIKNENILLPSITIVASRIQLNFSFFDYFIENNTSFDDIFDYIKKYNNYLRFFNELNENVFIVFSGIKINSDGYILSTHNIPDNVFLYVLYENKILPYKKVYDNTITGLSILEPYFLLDNNKFINLFDRKDTSIIKNIEKTFFIYGNSFFYNISRKIQIEYNNETILLNSIPFKLFKILSDDILVLKGSPVYDNENYFYGIVYDILPDNYVLVLEKKHIKNFLSLALYEIENLYEDILYMNKVNILNNLRKNIQSIYNMLFIFDGLLALNDFDLILYEGVFQFKKDDIIYSIQGNKIKSIHDFEKIIIENFFEKEITIEIIRENILQKINLKNFFLLKK